MVGPIAETVEVATVLWDVNDTEGLIFGCNMDVVDHCLEPEPQTDVPHHEGQPYSALHLP